MRTRIIGIASAALAVALALTGCSSSHGGVLGSQPGGAGNGNNNGNGNNGGNNGNNGNGNGPSNIKDSKYYGLTALTDTQLCGTMSTSEASAIIGKQTGDGQFTNTLGLGIICEWQVGGDSDNELYVGISTILDWQGAQAIAQLLKPTSLTVAGHPAVGAEPDSTLNYATLDVAVGAAHDPCIEFRAPTLDEAKALATLVMPRVIALAG